MNTITVYLKIVFTSRTITYYVDSNITITQFIDMIKSLAFYAFNLQNLEIIDVDQTELGNALLPENITLNQKYINKDFIAFYIRPISSCVICNNIENIRISFYYRCQHCLCENCFTQSLRHNLVRCPICRSDRNTHENINNVINL